MTEEKKQVIQYRLQRASEELTSAQVLLAAQRNLAAVNRLYYACFYAVNSLLETRDLASSKHSGVKALLHQHFIKTGTVENQWGKFYQHLYDTRHDVDYADFAEFSAESAQELYESAQRFVAEVTRLVEKEMIA